MLADTYGEQPCSTPDGPRSRWEEMKLEADMDAATATEAEGESEIDQANDVRDR